MEITEQIAWVEKWQCFHKGDDQSRDALIVIKQSLIALEKHITIKQVNQKYAMYQDFIRVYSEFLSGYVGIGLKMNAAEGKAMKNIIAYLVKESNSKDEAGALLAWQYVLKNWTKLSDFLQRQTSLLTINKNLIEILTQLRNGHNKSSQKARRNEGLAARIKGKSAH